MLPYTFISEFISSVAKPALSGFTAFLLALTPVMPDNMANFVDTAVSGVKTNRIHIEVGYEVPGSIGLITDDLSDENTSIGEFDLYFDLDNVSITAVWGENQEFIASADPYTVTYSPALTDIYVSRYTDTDRVYDITQEDVDKAYADNFKGKALVESTPASFYESGIYFDDIVGFTENRVRYSDECLSAVVEIFEHYFSKLGSKEITDIVAQYYGPQFELCGKLFEKSELNGRTTYSFYMDGLDYAALLLECGSIENDEEYNAFLESFSEIILGDLDIEKYAKEIFGEDSGKYGADAIKELFSAGYADSEDYESEYDAGFVGLGSLDAQTLKGILDYDPEEIDYLDYKSIFVSYIYPYFKNTYIAACVTAMDEKTTVGDITICTYDGEEEQEFYFDFAISPYEDEIPVADISTGTFTADDLEVKIAKAQARENGVYKTEISWWVSNFDSMENAQLSNSSIYVTHLDQTSRTLLEDSVIDKFSEENRAAILELIDSRLWMWDLKFDTEIKMIDNSVYLPLRKICELCGFDVEWDSTQNKAYVIRDGESFDMTGTLIDGKTYVKIRDFEKLGLTVDYTEDFYTDNDGNYKYCNVVISFFQ